ncbi:hypothetical protein ES703_42473 [subsurface metagenome]
MHIDSPGLLKRGDILPSQVLLESNDSHVSVRDFPDVQGHLSKFLRVLLLEGDKSPLPEMSFSEFVMTIHLAPGWNVDEADLLDGVCDLIYCFAGIVRPRLVGVVFDLFWVNLDYCHALPLSPTTASLPT